VESEPKGRVLVAPGDTLPDEVEEKPPYVVEVDGRKVATVVGLLDYRKARLHTAPNDLHTKGWRHSHRND